MNRVGPASLSDLHPSHGKRPTARARRRMALGSLLLASVACEGERPGAGVPPEPIERALGAAHGERQGFCGSGAPDGEYRMVPIGGLALPSFAADVNDHGVVVGSMNTASGERHAFVWRGAEMVDLGVLPGDGDSHARAINNHGQIVGESNLKTFGAAKAVFWSEGRIDVLPPLPGFDQARAVDINDRGQVVGLSLRVRPGSIIETRATSWEGGVGKPLDGASAVAINERGQVAGYEQGTFLGPVLWTSGEPFRLGGLQAVRDVNNLGVTVGHDEAEEVVLTWGRFTYPLGINGYGWSINDRLQVAGVYGPGLLSPFVWSLGKTIDLPTPGGGGGDAGGINRHGEVTGSDGFRAVLWTCDAVNRR